MDTRKKFRINSIITLVLICNIIIALAWLSTHYNLRLDLTQSKRHTIAQASQEMLKQMPENIEITAYARNSRKLRQAIKNFVGRYQQFKPNITLDFLDIDMVPDEIRRQGISVNGEMILHYKKHSTHVKKMTEQNFTNALERLVRGTTKWIFFLEGHGERSALGGANHDLKIWTKQLADRGFNIQPIHLANIQKIPLNTSLLIIASPAIHFLSGETKKIIQYLAHGGNMLWLSDPDAVHNAEILQKLGVTIPTGVVLDSAGSITGVDDPSIVVITPSLYPDHTITKDFNYTTFFPKATSIDIEGTGDWEYAPLLKSATHTWLETDLLTEKISYDKNRDVIGPLNLGIALQRKITNTTDPDQATEIWQKVIIIGDGDFLSNAYVNNSGNLALGNRLINWLSGDENFITILNSIIADEKLELSMLTAAIIAITFIIILPLLFIITGLIIWRHRKK